MKRIEQIFERAKKYYDEVGKLNLLYPGIENAESEGRRDAAEMLFNRAYELCFNSYMEIQNRIMPEIRAGKRQAAGFSSRHLERKFGELEFEMMALANSYVRTMNSMLREYMHLHDFKFKFNPPELKKKKERAAEEDWDFEPQKEKSGYDGWLNPDLRYGGQE